MHSAQFGQALFEGNIVGLSQVMRARADKIVFGKPRRSWPTNQGFAPGDVFARNFRGPGCAGGGIAVVNVEHETLNPQRKSARILVLKTVTQQEAVAPDFLWVALRNAGIADV